MKTISKSIWTQGIFNAVDDELWFVPFGKNYLCRCDINTMTVNKIVFLDMKHYERGGVYNTLRFKTKVFMVPAFEDDILVYDIEKDIVCRIAIPHYETIEEKFLYHYCFNEWIYLFPVSYPNIVRINVKTNEIEEVKSDCLDETDFVSIDIINNIVYMVNKTNVVYSFNLSSGGINKIEGSNPDLQFRTITVLNENQAIISDIDGNLYLYDTKKNVITLYMKSNIMLDSIWSDGKTIVMFPLLDKDYFAVLNYDSKEIHKVFLNNKKLYKQWPHSVFSKACDHNGSLLFFNTQYRTLLKYDIDSMKLDESNLIIKEVDTSTIRAMLKKSIDGSMPLVEGTEIHLSIENYIDSILT